MEIWDGEGVRRLQKIECNFAYRDSVFSANGGSASGGKHKPFIVLRAELVFQKSDPEIVEK